jgi:hypothetical protein
MRDKPPARRSRTRRALRALLPAGLLAVLLVLPASGSARAQTAPHNTNQPTVYGQAVQGRTLFTDTGSWSGSTPMTFQFRWLRCDTSGGGVNGVNCTMISGATQRTYVLTKADVGQRIRSHVIATNKDGSSSFNSNATAVVQSSAALAAPRNTQPPTVSGNPSEGSLLAANPGSWTSSSHSSYGYQWRRCDPTGGSCSSISGATQKTYTLKNVDVGASLRVQVTATNKNGSTIARSAPTAVISKAPLPSGATISINDVALPNRLMIDRYSFSPSPLRSHQTIIARFHVADSRNHNVMGALVFAEDIPLGQTTRPPEQATGPDGWVTFAIHPARRLRMHRGGEIVFFLRARKQGDNLFGGVTARRLVGLPFG